MVDIVEGRDPNSEAPTAPEMLEDLTDWENPPTVRDFKQDFQDAQSDQDSHITKVGTWLDNLNITGAAAIKKIKGHSNIVPKLIRKQAEWRYASLTEPFLSTEDIFNTEPITFEDKEAAVQNGLVINNQFNTKINKIKFIDEYIRTAVNEGTVVVRVGWDYEEEEVEVEVEQFTYTATNNQDDIQRLQEVQQMLQSNDQEALSQLPAELMEALRLSVEHGVPIAPVSSGFITEIQTQVVKNQPSVHICDYRNLTIDPSAEGDMDNAGFVIYSFESSLSALEKDGKYTNLKAINITSSSILGDTDHMSDDNTSFNFSDKPRKKFVVYEYWGFWDIDGTGIVKPIVAAYVGDVLIRLEENPYPDKKIPFVAVQYLPVKKSMYGEPDGELLEDNQKIIGAVTRGMIDTMGRSANGQQGSRKDALDVTNKRKFEKGEDYEFNAQVDPRTAFHMHTYPEIPQSAQFMLNMQNGEAESLTGVKAFAGGGIQGQALGESATGIRSALDATSKRELGILRRLAEGMKEIGRKFVSMNAIFLSEEEVIRITNEEFVTVKRDDLEGKIDISLTISTAEADEHKAEELAFMLQTTGQTMGPEFSQIILSEIATLRKMPSLSKAIKEYTPEPSPQEQEKEALEIELLKAQIANEYAKANENNANATLDNAKAQVEGATVDNVQSDTDLKNLEFVETETGTKHERDVDKISTQAESQAMKSIVEDRLITEKEAATKV